jgi:tetratricopeptide (TPR) repeat protein
MKRGEAVRVALIVSLLQCPAILRADTLPWAQVEAELKATETDVAKGGLLAIRDHVENLESALAEGGKSFPPPPAADGKATIPVDGQIETLVSLAGAAANKQGAIAVFNPYPSAALYLALYYNEIHKPDDALRVIDAGMKLSTPQGLEFGAHMPALYGERAAAFETLRRFQDAFDVCDKGLKLGSAGKMDQARMYRCRGFALTELNRLDDAQTSYEESLKLEPENPLAKREMAYIAKLRAGANRAPPEQVLTPATPAPENTSNGVKKQI